jgi:hypothetical protein
MAPWGQAAATVLDAFSVAQNVNNGNPPASPPGTYYSKVDSGSVLGGQRFFQINHVSGNGTFSLDAALNATLLQFSLATAVTGRAEVVWAGPGGTSTTPGSGFNPPIDLTEGGTINQMNLVGLYGDLANNSIRVEVYSSNGTAEWTEVLPTGGVINPVNRSKRFTQFTKTSGAGTLTQIFETVTKLQLSIPDPANGNATGGNSIDLDCGMDEINTECVVTSVTIASLTADPNPIPYNEANSTISWTTVGADKVELCDLVGGVEQNCQVVGLNSSASRPEGVYRLKAKNECTPTHQDITITKGEPPTGACCVLVTVGEHPWEDIYRCDTGKTEAECDATEGSQGWEPLATNCSMLDCEAPPPPPPPVVPAFNPLGLLLFAGLIPLSWALISRRKK